MCRVLVLSAVLLTVSACSRQNEQPVTGPASEPTNETLAGNPYGEYVIGTPVSYENLAVFPVSSARLKNDDRFITLDEGIAAGSVKIIEVGADEGDENENTTASSYSQGASSAQVANRERADANAVAEPHANREEAEADDLFGPPRENFREQSGAQVQADVSPDDENPFATEELDGEVNTLMVHNTSGKPLYLMPGEVISGGKQDRTIGEEVVIASNHEPVAIDVFCVEHGRWEGRSVEGTTMQLREAEEFSTNISLVVSSTSAVEELAKEANQGKFVASVGYLSKDARLAVQEAGDQTKVWEEVAKTNSKVGNDSESGNFAESYLSSDVVKGLEPFVEKLKSAGEAKQIVGVAVAINGKMHSVDIFESTPLFKKFWPKLLKSYALDAVSANGDVDSTKRPALTIDDCIAFLKEIEKSDAETEDLSDGQKIATRRSSAGIAFSYYDAESTQKAAAPSAPAMGGFGGRGYGGGGFGGAGYGGSVHTSVLAK